MNEPVTVQEASYSAKLAIRLSNFLGRIIAIEKIVADAGITAVKLATGAVTTAKILDSNVTLAKLADGIKPSHIVVKAGKITWSGSGATLNTAVAGVLSTDIVVATIQTKPTQAAYLVGAVPSTDQVALELSAANTANNAVIAYTVLRAVA